MAESAEHSIIRADGGGETASGIRGPPSPLPGCNWCFAIEIEVMCNSYRIKPKRGAEIEVHGLNSAMIEDP
jgi:hypothetical protein